jgi:hypothetical protein
MQMSEAASAQSGDVGETRDGIQDSRLLLCGEDGTPDNYKLNLSYAVTDWKAPRHRHNFDQIRYAISGEFVYATDKVLPPGWVAYFPEGIHYGPQIRKQGLVLMLCQLGGSSGNGFLSKMQRYRAFEELGKKGTFHKGVYTWLDENGQKHNQDSSEAVSEHALGGKLIYPKPRYNDIILMNPEAFDWVESANIPGVAYRWMGTFTERESRVGFIRIEKGATFNGGMVDTTELLFLAKGSVTCRERTFPVHSAFSFEESEGPIPVVANETVEFLCIHLPKFKKAAAGASEKRFAHA